jgi:hypothetical protein
MLAANSGLIISAIQNIKPAWKDGMSRSGQSRFARTNPSQNAKRTARLSLREAVRQANRRAHEQANRRSGRRELRSVQAAIASVADADDFHMARPRWLLRASRWLAGLLMLPFCFVTTVTFLRQFENVALDQGLWQSERFCYFAAGGLLTCGWLLSGFLRKGFLYLYVLGHELTHALFVILHRGRVTDIHVSSDGGFITTDKSNLLIALSPYFVPFWSLVCTLVYGLSRIWPGSHGYVDLAFYAAIGASWSFHMAWTLWMIPRDQPDLQENGTFFSLMIIYLANVLVLAGLLCFAGSSPMANAKVFVWEWSRHAVDFLRQMAIITCAWSWQTPAPRAQASRAVLPTSVAPGV